jgi:hypothetical protein
MPAQTAQLWKRKEKRDSQIAIWRSLLPESSGFGLASLSYTVDRILRYSALLREDVQTSLKGSKVCRQEQQSRKSNGGDRKTMNRKDGMT